jgi:hypothetical protein
MASTEALERVTPSQLAQLTSFERQVLLRTRPPLPAAGLPACLPFILWDELKLLSPSDLESLNISIDIPFVDPIPQWAMWRPPFRELANIHHFRLNDELHGYNLDSEWTFPGFQKDGNVIFAVRGVEDEMSAAENSVPFLLDLDRLLTHWVAISTLNQKAIR